MVNTSRLLSIQGGLVAFLAIMIITGIASSSYAQKASGGKRQPRVEVEEVKTRILTNFADVQGRVVAGPRTPSPLLLMQLFDLGTGASVIL